MDQKGYLLTNKKGLSQNIKYLVLILLGFLILAYFVTPFRVTDYIIFCIFVIGFDLLYGHMGKLSFGHMLYLGTGAYAAALLSEILGGNPFLIILFGCLAASLLGFLLGPIIIKTSGASFALINLAFNQVGYFLILVPLATYTRGDDGLPVYFSNIGPIDLNIPAHRFTFSLCFLLLVFYLANRLINSPFGTLIHAIKNNELRVNFMGYNTFVIQWINFSISAGVSGLAGALLAINYGYVTPSFIDPHRNVEVIFASLIGSSGSLIGAVIGGTIYMLISNFIADFIIRWEAFLGIILLILVFKFRQGIWGFLEKLFTEREG